MIETDKELGEDVITSKVYNGLNELIMINRYKYNDNGIPILLESVGVNGHMSLTDMANS